MIANERLMDEAIALARVLDRLAQHSYQIAAEKLAKLREDLSVLVIRYDPTSLRYSENQRTRLAAGRALHGRPTARGIPRAAGAQPGPTQA